MLPKSILKFLIGAVCLAYFPFGPMQVLRKDKLSLLDVRKGDSDVAPPWPFDVGDGDDYGQRRLELTVPSKYQCDGNNCTPCAIVVGYPRIQRNWY